MAENRTSYEGEAPDTMADADTEQEIAAAAGDDAEQEVAE